MLLTFQKTCFMLIDVQEKLTPLVIGHQKLVEKSQWLLRLANELKLPVVVTEQYPKGLGHTVSSLKALCDDAPTFEKVHFSAGKDDKVVTHLQSQQYQHIVLFGIEAHVCVMQTAMDLKDRGFNVFVVADSISARAQQSINLGLQRMCRYGIEIVTTEMVFFELIEKAGTPEFKALSQAFLQ